MFVGIKMLMHHFYEIPTGIALGVVGGVLLVAILTSIVWPRKVEGIPAPSLQTGKEAELGQSSQKDKG
jgi:tellurite resistance protein TerC